MVVMDPVSINLLLIGWVLALMTNNKAAYGESVCHRPMYERVNIRDDEIPDDDTCFKLIANASATTNVTANSIWSLCEGHAWWPQPLDNDTLKKMDEWLMNKTEWGKEIKFWIDLRHTANGSGWDREDAYPHKVPVNSPEYAWMWGKNYPRPMGGSKPKELSEEMKQYWADGEPKYPTEPGGERNEYCAYAILKRETGGGGQKWYSARCDVNIDSEHAVCQSDYYEGHTEAFITTSISDRPILAKCLINPLLFRHSLISFIILYYLY